MIINKVSIELFKHVVLPSILHNNKTYEWLGTCADCFLNNIYFFFKFEPTKPKPNVREILLMFNNYSNPNYYCIVIAIFVGVSVEDYMHLPSDFVTRSFRSEHCNSTRRPFITKPLNGTLNLIRHTDIVASCTAKKRFPPLISLAHSLSLSICLCLSLSLSLVSIKDTLINRR